MLASVEKGFVLLSNPKSGTTALEAAFEKYADIRTGGSPKWKHINYDRMVGIFGDYFERRGCMVYGVARHPVDTLASWYRYRSRRQLASPRHQQYTGDIPFSQFVEEWADRRTLRAKVPVSVKWCLTRGGKPAPITFYRYEDVPLLFEVLSAHVGGKVAQQAQRLAGAPARHRPGGDRGTAPDAEYIEIYDRIPFVGT